MIKGLVIQISDGAETVSTGPISNFKEEINSKMGIVTGFLVESGSTIFTIEAFNDGELLVSVTIHRLVPIESLWALIKTVI